MEDAHNSPKQDDKGKKPEIGECSRETPQQVQEKLALEIAENVLKLIREGELRQPLLQVSEQSHTSEGDEKMHRLQVANTFLQAAGVAIGVGGLVIAAFAGASKLVPDVCPDCNQEAAIGGAVIVFCFLVGLLLWLILKVLKEKNYIDRTCI